MEKERLKFCIDRFDHYYDSINNKSSVFLGLGTFVFSGLIASYPYLQEHVNCSTSLLVLFSISIALAFSAIIIAITASTPYLSKEKNSMYYFYSISEKKRDTFIGESKNIGEKDDLSDLRVQVHGLATGLSKKFSQLRIVAILNTLMFVSLIPLVILILVNFKS
jgi:hypothetical protein